MPFKNENISIGLSANSTYQSGKSDVDSGLTEVKSTIPWATSPTASWLYYDCTVDVLLDSGIVVHNRLPQVNNIPDTLASLGIDNPLIAGLIGGVNLKSLDQYKDIVQRMAHSRYWFHLFGEALRVGFQVPIPGLVSVGGVVAIPHDQNPQQASNRIAPGCNYGGVLVWHAQWSLWYTTQTPPVSQSIPVADPSAGINAAIAALPPPPQMQAPFSQRDSDAVTSAPFVPITKPLK